MTLYTLLKFQTPDELLRPDSNTSHIYNFRITCVVSLQLSVYVCVHVCVVYMVCIYVVYINVLVCVEVEGRSLRPGLCEFEVKGSYLRPVSYARRVFETAGLSYKCNVFMLVSIFRVSGLLQTEQRSLSV